MCKRTRYLGKSSHKQQGFSLFMVLVILVLIAVAVVAGTQWTNTELRSSSNTADRQFAVSIAEAAVRDAEAKLLDRLSSDSEDNKKDFDKDCKGGWCLPNFETPHWTTSNAFSDDKSVEFKVGENAHKNPRYIIEWMGKDNPESTNIYRITVRAWGKNDKTQVTIQVYDEIMND